MFRDGARESIWQSEARRLESTSNSNKQYDVAIIGGGITGISTAHRLQLAGFRCILLEANNVGFGTTGGTTAHLNDFFDTTFKETINKFGLENARLLMHAGKEALQIFRSNVYRHKINCDFQVKDAVLFAINDQQEKQLEDIVDGAKQVGYEMTYTELVDFPIPFKKAALIRDQAQFHPIKYINSLADVFTMAGGVIVENCLYSSHEERDKDVLIQTSLGEIRTRNAVFATHTPPGINLLHFTTAPYRSYVIAFTIKDNKFPDKLGYDLNEPYHYYRTQEVDGKKMIIAGGEDHKTGHMEDTGACFSKLENYCRQYFNVDKIEFGWSSQYFEPVDGLPSIGVFPSSDGRIFVATGFRGNGMTFGTLSSKIIADLITGTTNRFAKLFDPKRFRPAAGFTTFVKENATVLKDMVVDKISMERVKSLAAIKNGEAKVIRYNDNSYAIYAEHQGKMHILKSTCRMLNVKYGGIMPNSLGIVHVMDLDLISTGKF